MHENVKNIIIIIEFFLLLSITLIANIIKKDDEISISERRKLASFPEITIASVLNGETSKKFDKYASDQFIKRDFFRKIKYLYSMNILKQKDNNKFFIKNDSIYKMEYPLEELLIEKSVKKIQEIYENYLQGMNIYYSVIPDKVYYLNDDHLKIDYSKIEKVMQNNLSNMKYIDIKNILSVDDFYKTDLHWKQENITNIAKKIKKSMNLSLDDIDYIEKELGNFYGVYYGQTEIAVNPDKLKYLVNDTIENCITYNFETEEEGRVYDLEKYNTSLDKYDIFLSGATPLISVENPNATTEKELLFFRDSFGSSLAPLLMENYRKITLIDIRYISSNLLDKFIDFKNQDVLFLYSSTVLNKNILK